MRRICLLLIAMTFFNDSAFTQITVGNDPEFLYANMRSRLNPGGQKQIKGWEDTDTTGVCLLLGWEKDTLNKRDLRADLPGVNVVSVTLDGVPIETYNIDSGRMISYKPAQVFQDEGRLYVEIGDADDRFLFHSIYKGKVTSRFIRDGFKAEYKTATDAELAKGLSINGDVTSMIMSSQSPRKGEILYLRVVFISDPFYKVDTSFQSGFIYLRHKITYLLRALVRVAVD